MSDAATAFRAILRQDLPSFIRKSFATVAPAIPYLENWHIQAMAWHLEEVYAGRIKRLIISVPPRHLKSISASVAFPAWVLGKDPTRRIISVSYAQDIARKHALDFRSVMDATWYRKTFRGTRIDPRKNTELEIMTTDRGFRLTTSVGGTLTGRGGNLIIIDDPLKPIEAMSETARAGVNQWYDNTLYSRLDNKAEDRIVIVMQRLHVDDLVGHVLGQEDWVHLKLPATAEVDEKVRVGPNKYFERHAGELLHPEREPREALDKIKATLGSYNFSAQYQQAPAPPGGALIKWNWFGRYRETPQRQHGDCIVQSWDTASKTADSNDYSVCTTWLVRGKNYYLIDVLRKRLEYPDLKRQIIAQAERHETGTVLIEDAGSGTHLIQDLDGEGELRPIAIHPKGDKLTRMVAHTAILEAGYVHLPESAGWLPDFETEMLLFPHGRHDDQVDSVSQFLTRETQPQPEPRIRFL